MFAMRTFYLPNTSGALCRGTLLSATPLTSAEAAARDLPDHFGGSIVVRGPGFERRTTTSCSAVDRRDAAMLTEMADAMRDATGPIEVELPRCGGSGTSAYVTAIDGSPGLLFSANAPLMPKTMRFLEAVIGPCLSGELHGGPEPIARHDRSH